MQVSTLRPGLLVSLKTSVVGNVKYAKEVIESEHLTEEGAQLTRWETLRTIVDPAEHRAACKVRDKAGSIIRGVCVHSAFGLLCSEAGVDNLERALVDARKVADDFNGIAKLTRVHVYAMMGRIAPDDVEAVRAINSEVRDLLADMERGLSNLDVKVVREAAGRAKQIGLMLSPAAADRIKVAIDAARSSARKIVKAAEQAAQEVDLLTIKKIAEQRTAFLDLDPAGEVAAPAEGGGRALDLDPDVKATAAEADENIAWGFRSPLEV